MSCGLFCLFLQYYLLFFYIEVQWRTNDMTKKKEQDPIVVFGWIMIIVFIIGQALLLLLF